MLAGVTLALLPATTRGFTASLVAQAVAVRLLGPALLLLARAFPTAPCPRPRRRMGTAVLWAPALLLVPLYTLSWREPVRWAPLVPTIDQVVLAGYLAAAGLRALAPLRRPLAPHERAQARWLALGLAGGVAPVVLLSLLPQAVPGRALVPTEVSVLACAALPLCVALAIVRVEFLGIPALAHRRPLRVVLGLLWGAGTALGARWLVLAAPRGWGWAPDLALSGAILGALGSGAVFLWVLRAVERAARCL